MGIANIVVTLGDNEAVDIRLPDGRLVRVRYCTIDRENELPELVIQLPAILAVNCYDDKLKRATNGHVMLAKLLVIPLED